jgi:serine/threonine protein kinase
MPSQGWKIHVSATQHNAAETLAAVWEYCVPRDIPFKVISSPLGVRMRNVKYAPREASGKAVTIYPADDAACERILRELDARLGGATGPYILSDLRYRGGPLYVRYGGFLRRSCQDATGEVVAAIEDPAGRLVPDPRSTVFTVPEWVQVPRFLASQLAARNSGAGLSGVPYEVTGALHFSNGGGVYTGIDQRDGTPVILKEARPHAGLAADGSDAVARLRRERDLMSRLAGLGIAPEVRDYFQADEHHFLVEELIEGDTLNSVFVGRYPLTAPDPGPEALEAHVSWVVRICGRVERAAELMHERGVVFNDLHMFNIMVRPDETVAFIDFEAASDLSEGRHVTVGNPGFAAPRDRTGLAVDGYSLACLRLALFLPLTTLFPVDLGKAADLAAQIAMIFPVPAGFLDEAVTQVMGTPHRAGPATAASRPAPSPEAGATMGRALPDGLVAAIRASATPDRTDRLFPGDVDQFRVAGGGLGFGYGAAGVLFALWQAAGVREPDYEEWFLARAQDPPGDMRLGLYDGLSGVAWTLAQLGHHDAAVRVAGMCAGAPWAGLGHGLFGGLPGFALALLDVADLTGEPALADVGRRAAEVAASTGAAPDSAGLMRGAAGRALLLIRMHERTGDPGYLDAAQAAIRADLSQCVTDRTGGLQVNEGWRIMPYFLAGSAGLGLVIDQYLAHREDAGLRAAADQIALASSAVYYAQPGLFNGRAGLLYFLASRIPGEPSGSRVHAHVQRLAWHAVPYHRGLAFPGDMLYRLSMDLGTGTAGVLLGVARALRPHAVALPGFTVTAPTRPLPRESSREDNPRLARR